MKLAEAIEGLRNFVKLEDVDIVNQDAVREVLAWLVELQIYRDQHGYKGDN